ncbi:hypothetical protein DM02DRAFT_99615 [Periconia macrospinosa]|uniref:AtPDCT1/2 transmembrane domain-containing protein n=1 Tax=Periconia macrospinosa TaxID=97972 RepID=A0A2V1E4D3_9PLEO|nr:hypothetical protein DM02DRAFT_99615 [Periconia macrospinosa]
MLIFLRTLVITIALYFWYYTQSLLSHRTLPAQEATSVSSIHDEVHSLTSGLHARISRSTKLTNVLLATSSATMDLLALFLLTIAIFGPTFAPAVGLILLLSLRQLAQSFCRLPLPIGIIWRNPGISSIFVTYEVKNDLFFSGHTAFSVYGALIVRSMLGNCVGIPLGLFLVSFQITVVLLLRVHYTMDVFTGVFCALYIYHINGVISPYVDEFFFMISHT